MSLKDIAANYPNRFAGYLASVEDLLTLCLEDSDRVIVTTIGKSIEGRDIFAFQLGTGPIKVSVISGSHADEPLGTETIDLLIRSFLSGGETASNLLQRCTFFLIPQINPDGEYRNRHWMNEWPSLETYIKKTVRELPGNDIEFGYPSMRPENAAAAEYWRSHAPIDLHVSLHGMGFAEGVMMLIERHWTSRTQHVRDAYTSLAATLGLGLHTHNRKGEKGFFYIEDGYTTTPEGAAMQDHFRGIRDFETAALFHSSSMEFMRSIGPDPLSIVTEIPLFAMDHSGSDTLIPENYVSFRDALPNLRLRLERGDSIQAEIDRFGIRAVPVRDAMQLQLAAIELGIETVEANRE